MLADSVALVRLKETHFYISIAISHLHLCFRASIQEFARANLIFNIPLALMMLASLIILTFWIEIYTRCIELGARSTTSASRSFIQAVLSKPAMCNSRFS